MKMSIQNLKVRWWLLTKRADISLMIYKLNIKLKILNIITRIKKMPRDASSFLRDWSEQLRNNIGDMQASLRTPSPLQKLREDIIRLLFLKDSSTITDEEIINKIKELQSLVDEQTKEITEEISSRWALDNIS
tara:strand:- start:4042 stop:4440 length:399 start_codon:yes stop_codon:yes gene_type:complete